jgi:hypothetical protein
MPNPKDGQTSIFRHGKEPSHQLCQIGVQYLNRPFHGAAILTASEVRATLLDVRAMEPPPRHANIINWPTGEDAEEAKGKRKLLAQKLAEAAILVKREN